MNDKNNSWLWIILTLLVVTVIGHADKQVERKFRRIAMVVTAILILLPLSAAYYVNLPSDQTAETITTNTETPDLPEAEAETAEINSNDKQTSSGWKWEVTWGNKKIAGSDPQPDSKLEEVAQDLQETKQNLEQVREEVAAIESETKNAWQRFKDKFLND